MQQAALLLLSAALLLLAAAALLRSSRCVRAAVAAAAARYLLAPLPQADRFHGGQPQPVCQRQRSKDAQRSYLSPGRSRSPSPRGVARRRGASAAALKSGQGGPPAPLPGSQQGTGRDSRPVLSFGGCGFLYPYQLGVALFATQRLDAASIRCAGHSAGFAAALSVACGLPPEAHWDVLQVRRACPPVCPPDSPCLGMQQSTVNSP